MTQEQWLCTHEGNGEQCRPPPSQSANQDVQGYQPNEEDGVVVEVPGVKQWPARPQTSQALGGHLGGHEVGWAVQLNVVSFSEHGPVGLVSLICRESHLRVREIGRFVPRRSEVVESAEAEQDPDGDAVLYSHAKSKAYLTIASVAEALEGQGISSVHMAAGPELDELQRRLASFKTLIEGSPDNASLKDL